MKNIAILGSTGSIGTQTLEVVENNQDIQVTALAAGSNIVLLEEQIRNVLSDPCGPYQQSFRFLNRDRVLF